MFQNFEKFKLRNDWPSYIFFFTAQYKQIIVYGSHYMNFVEKLHSIVFQLCLIILSIKTKNYISKNSYQFLADSLLMNNLIFFVISLALFASINLTNTLYMRLVMELNFRRFFLNAIFRRFSYFVVFVP